MRNQTWLMIIMVIAIMCYLSTPSLGEVANQEKEIPECVQKYGDCFEEHRDNDLKDPKFDRDSPEFDMKEYLCCPLLKQTVIAEKECFCSSPVAAPFFFMLLDDTLGRPKKGEETNNASGTRVLRFCGVVDDSVLNWAAFCQVSSPLESSPSEVMAKKNTSNASGRNYNTLTVFIISILICVSVHLNKM